VVLLDVIAATTVLPALLAILGHRVNSLRLPVPWVKSNTKADADHCASGREVDVAETGGWYRLAHSVMRRPLVYTVAIVAVLAVMAAPFANVIFGGYTSRVLPVSAPGRVVSDTLARDFPSNATNPIQVVVEGVQNPAVVPAYVKQLGSVEGAAGAAVAAVQGDNVLVRVAFNGDPISSAARATLARVRAVPPPAGAHVHHDDPGFAGAAGLADLPGGDLVCDGGNVGVLEAAVLPARGRHRVLGGERPGCEERAGAA